MSKFEKSQLYRTYYRLEDEITGSQGAESEMSASLRNKIRSVEPQNMPNKVVVLHITGFLKRQHASSVELDPLPPKAAQNIARMILRALEYQPSAKFIDGTCQMEVKVRRMTDGSKYRRVVLPT